MTKFNHDCVMNWCINVLRHCKVNTDSGCFQIFFGFFSNFFFEQAERAVECGVYWLFLLVGSCFFSIKSTRKHEELCSFAP